MAEATTGRNSCFICQKEKVTYKCEGCSNNYCRIHIREHENELHLELDQIENQRNLFKQNLSQQIEQPNQQTLIKQINLWEDRSIEIIRQNAEQNRQFVFKQTKQHFNNIEIDLNQLTDEIKEIRKENDFNEIHLNQLKQKLDQLQTQLNNPTNICLNEENSSSSFINKISVSIEHSHQSMNIPIDLKWKSNAITVAGGNGQGQQMNQLNSPWSISIDDDKTIYVVEYGNHRIVEWKKDSIIGRIVAGGNGEGNGNHQLNQPRKVIIDKINDCFIIADQGNRRVVRWPRQNGHQGQIIINNVSCYDIVMHKNEYLYVCDNEKQEVRRWKIGESQGVIVAGGNGCGNLLNQLNKPQSISIDEDETIYVSDCSNHRVMKWIKGAKEGIIVAGGQGQGNSLNQLYYPQGIVVDRSGTLYVSDYYNHRIVRWIKNAKEGTIIAGGKNAGNQSNQLNYPVGLSLDDENNLYIADFNNHRIQKYFVDK